MEPRPIIRGDIIPDTEIEQLWSGKVVGDPQADEGRTSYDCKVILYELGAVPEEDALEGIAGTAYVEYQPPLRTNRFLNSLSSLPLLRRILKAQRPETPQTPRVGGERQVYLPLAHESGLENDVMKSDLCGRVYSPDDDRIHIVLKKTFGQSDIAVRAARSAAYNAVTFRRGEPTVPVANYQVNFSGYMPLEDPIALGFGVWGIHNALVAGFYFDVKVDVDPTKGGKK